MRRSACLLAALLFSSSGAAAWGQSTAPTPPRKLPDGVYAVLREAPKEKDVRPLKDGETLVVNRHRYAKDGDKEPPRFLVVRTAPDVVLDLAGAPEAVKEGKEVVRVLLKLRPKAATALERLTSDRLGKSIAVVVGGEVVTQHAIRSVIKGGNVQITCCGAGAANYLFEQLRARPKNK